MRAVSASARKPALRLSRKTLSPVATKARLTPLSGTTSHTVASATRSSSGQQVGLGTVAVEALAAEHARGCDQEQEDDSGGGEMALAGEVVLAVGVEHGKGRRQLFVRLMMIEHDDFGARRHWPQRWPLPPPFRNPRSG